MLPAAATSLSLLQLLCSLLRKQWPASPDSDAFNDLSRSTLLHITSCASLSLSPLMLSSTARRNALAHVNSEYAGAVASSD
jgi:hypothetical protein